MNALANALAHGQANAMRPTSVHAKRREGKGPHRTTPDLNLLGVLQASNVTYVPGAPRASLDDCER